MAWITAQQVSTLLQTDLSTDEWVPALIAHAQALAEIEVGEQDPVSGRLQAVLAQIVARMWQAGQSAQVNPAGFAAETVGPFQMQDRQGGAAGLGLTNREISQLRRAAGRTGLWVQPTSRGDHLETAGAGAILDGDVLDPIDRLAAAQADLARP